MRHQCRGIEGERGGGGGVKGVKREGQGRRVEKEAQREQGKNRAMRKKWGPGVVLFGTCLLTCVFRVGKQEAESTERQVTVSKVVTSAFKCMPSERS